MNGRESERVVLTKASAVTPRTIDFLWTQRVPLRALTVLAGEPGLAKSLATHELAARVSNGELEGDLKGQPRDVLLASAEDHFESVIVPRLIVAGADLDRVHRVHVADRGHEGLLTFPDHIDALEWEVARLDADFGRSAALLVVDPISAFLTASTDSHKTADVRRALAPLAALAERENLAVLAVAHLNKSTTAKLLDRLSGSAAFGAAPRSVLALARHPDDPEGEHGSERVLVHVKSNYSTYAPTLGLRVEATKTIAEIGVVPYLTETGVCEISPDDLRPSRGESSSRDREEAILDALATGPRSSSEVKRQVAEHLDCSPRTVERAAKRLAERGELLITSQNYPRRTTWTLGPVATNGRVATGVVATERTP